MKSALGMTRNDSHRPVIREYDLGDNFGPELLFLLRHDHFIISELVYANYKELFHLTILPKSLSIASRRPEAASKDLQEATPHTRRRWSSS